VAAAGAPVVSRGAPAPGGGDGGGGGVTLPVLGAILGGLFALAVCCCALLLVRRRRNKHYKKAVAALHARRRAHHDTLGAGAEPRREVSNPLHAAAPRTPRAPAPAPLAQAPSPAPSPAPRPSAALPSPLAAAGPSPSAARLLAVGAPPLDPAALVGDEWIAHVAASRGVPYYVHRVSGERAWAPPAGARLFVVVAGAGVRAWSGAAPLTAAVIKELASGVAAPPERRSEPSAPLPSAPPGWVAHWSASQKKPYFSNAATREKVWHVPGATPATPAAPRSARAAPAAAAAPTAAAAPSLSAAAAAPVVEQFVLPVEDDLPALEAEAQEWIEAITHQTFAGPTFSESLNDGVLLVELVNAIKPGTITKYNEHPTKPIKKQENVTLFLQAVRGFGMKEFELFGTLDLCGDAPDPKKLRVVVSSIHALGRLMQSPPFAEMDLPRLGVKVAERRGRGHAAAADAEGGGDAHPLEPHTPLEPLLEPHTPLEPRTPHGVRTPSSIR
jgi:hypothetical protein